MYGRTLTHAYVVKTMEISDQKLTPVLIILEQSMGARNLVVIGLSYWPGSLIFFAVFWYDCSNRLDKNGKLL
jgi:hypothetical protein